MKFIIKCCLKFFIICLKICVFVVMLSPDLIGNGRICWCPLNSLTHCTFLYVTYCILMYT